MEDATLVRLMIVHYQAMLNTALDDGARKIVLQLLTEAELELSKIRRTPEQTRLAVTASRKRSAEHATAPRRRPGVVS